MLDRRDVLDPMHGRSRMIIDRGGGIVQHGPRERCGAMLMIAAGTRDRCSRSKVRRLRWRHGWRCLHLTRRTIVYLTHAKVDVHPLFRYLRFLS